MNWQIMTEQIIYTNKAECRDCYRCVRVCPVKAIQVKDGQAAVIDERCIGCGDCIRNCPQNAKTYRNDLQKAMAVLKNKKTAVVSLAPSFVALFEEWERLRLPSALRKLGFRYVEETAVGAWHSARASSDHINEYPQKQHICSACPAVVNYIERYLPGQAGNIVPVVSPMIAHARLLREKYGSDCSVVFIGPCVAKKGEAERPGFTNDLDCVLTFEELLEWFKKENLQFQALEESDFDDCPAGQARYYPVEGGMLQTMDAIGSTPETDRLEVSGFTEVSAALQFAASSGQPLIIEPLMCEQGCLNGPAFAGDKNTFARRAELLNWLRKNKGTAMPDEPGQQNLGTTYSDQKIIEKPLFSEKEIEAVLRQTGKFKDEDELNCRACGYETCRDKAIAVLEGLAEPEMCMPYMRRMAQNQRDRIIESTPNGILILNEQLQIVQMNPAFRTMFHCSDAVLGKPLSYLMNPEQFEQLLTGQEQVIKRTVEHSNYNLVCHQILYALPDQNQYVGIFVNITSQQDTRKQLDSLKSQTILQARELLEHQVQMAQQMAKFLGESTARGEKLVDNLLEMSETEDAADDANRKSIWDIYTSK